MAKLFWMALTIPRSEICFSVFKTYDAIFKIKNINVLAVIKVLSSLFVNMLLNFAVSLKMFRLTVSDRENSEREIQDAA